MIRPIRGAFYRLAIVSALAGVRSSLRQADSNAKRLMLAEGLLNWGGGFFLVARPIYLYAIGFSAVTVGELFTLQALLAIIFSIPIAMASDVFGRRRFVVMGLLLDGAGAFLYFYSSNLTALAGAQVLFAFVNAAAGAPFLALFTDSTSSENRNELFVLLGFIGGISVAVGAYLSALPIPLAGLLNFGEFGGYRLLFLMVSLSSFAGSAVVALFVTEVRKRGEHEGGFSWRGMVKLPKKSMGVVLKFSVIGFTGFGAGLIIPLLSLWFTLRYSVDITVAGPLFGTIFLVTAFASLFTPAMARKRGSVFTIVATELSAIVLLVSIPLAPDYFEAGTLLVARSTLANMAAPITNSFVMGLVHPDERATAASIIQLFDGVPRAYAPAISGYLFSLGLINLPFYITALFYLVSSSLFYLFFRHVKPPAYLETRLPAPSAEIPPSP